LWCSRFTSLIVARCAAAREGTSLDDWPADAVLVAACVAAAAVLTDTPMAAARAATEPDQPHRPPTPQRVSSVPADLAPREGILNHLIG
jgi:hypothetical protein